MQEVVWSLDGKWIWDGVMAIEGFVASKERSKRSSTFCFELLRIHVMRFFCLRWICLRELRVYSGLGLRVVCGASPSKMLDLESSSLTMGREALEALWF